MKKTQQTQQPTTQIQGLVTDGKLVASKDGRYVTIYFADGSKVREHRNRFLAVLGEAFVPEPKKERADSAASSLTTGFIAKTRMLLSKDGNYLLIYFPGGRFSRHVNYVRASLGLAYESTAKTAMS